MLDAVQISKGNNYISWQICDPEYGTITTVGSIPINEWLGLRMLLKADLGLSSGSYETPTETRLFDYLVVLFIHNNLIFDERDSDGREKTITDGN